MLDFNHEKILYPPIYRTPFFLFHHICGGNCATAGFGAEFNAVQLLAKI